MRRLVTDGAGWVGFRLRGGLLPVEVVKRAPKVAARAKTSPAGPGDDGEESRSRFFRGPRLSGTE
jgi:hypothetical protein